MGFVAIISEFFRQDGIPTIKGTGEDGTDLSISHCSPPGDDSPPMISDRAAVVDAGGTGTYNAVGYVDVENVGNSLPGEKRFYARDAEGGAVSELYMDRQGGISIVTDGGGFILNEQGEFNFENDGGANIEALTDGTINLSNGSGFINLLANGNVVINGLVIDPNGNLSTPGDIDSTSVSADSIDAEISLTAQNKQIANHTHPAGTPPGTTGPNL